MNEFNYLAAFIAMILAVFYFLPAMIADVRKTAYRITILRINVFFGWTILGWLAALLWACTEKIERRAEWQPY